MIGDILRTFVWVAMCRNGKGSVCRNGMLICCKGDIVEMSQWKMQMSVEEVITNSCRGNVAILQTNVAVGCRYVWNWRNGGISHLYASQEGGKSVS